LMSVPPATEMFQFAGFASRPYEFRSRYPGSSPGWVAPFGDPGITDRSHLPRAFRSVPRPSSPLSAKASTRCPYLRLITGIPARSSQKGMPHKTAAHRGKTLQDTQQPHMKTLLRIRAHGGAARPIRLGHITNSLFTLQSAPPPRAPQRRGTVSRVIFSEPRAPAFAGVGRGPKGRGNACRPANPRPPVVEVNGIEPMTSCLQSRRSPN
jgi:hypothetical protein